MNIAKLNVFARSKSASHKNVSEMYLSELKAFKKQLEAIAHNENNKYKNKKTMRKSQEVNKAIAILRKKGDKISLNQAEVLGWRHSEVWVFEHYVQNVSDECRDEATYCAARDAALFLSGKLELAELIPDAEQYPIAEKELKESSGKDRMKRLEERVAELEHVIALLSEKINLTVRDEDLGYMTSKEVVDYIGCPVSLMRNWRKKSVLPYYRRGSRIFYHKKDIDNSTTIKKYMKTHGTLAKGIR